MNPATARNLILNDSRLKIASKLSKLQFSREKTVECLPFFVELFLFTFNTANEINQLSKFYLLTDYFAIAIDVLHLRVESQ